MSILPILSVSVRGPPRGSQRWKDKPKSQFQLLDSPTKNRIDRYKVQKRPPTRGPLGRLCQLTWRVNIYEYYYVHVCPFASVSFGLLSKKGQSVLFLHLLKINSAAIVDFSASGRSRGGCMRLLPRFDRATQDMTYALSGRRFYLMSCAASFLDC